MEANFVSQALYFEFSIYKLCHLIWIYWICFHLWKWHNSKCPFHHLMLFCKFQSLRSVCFVDIVHSSSYSSMIPGFSQEISKCRFTHIQIQLSFSKRIYMWNSSSRIFLYISNGVSTNLLWISCAFLVFVDFRIPYLSMIPWIVDFGFCTLFDISGNYLQSFCNLMMIFLSSSVVSFLFGAMLPFCVVCTKGLVVRLTRYARHERRFIL